MGKQERFTHGVYPQLEQRTAQFCRVASLSGAGGMASLGGKSSDVGRATHSGNTIGNNDGTVNDTTNIASRASLWAGNAPEGLEEVDASQMQRAFAESAGVWGRGLAVNDGHPPEDCAANVFVSGKHEAGGDVVNARRTSYSQGRQFTRRADGISEVFSEKTDGAMQATVSARHTASERAFSVVIFAKKAISVWAGFGKKALPQGNSSSGSCSGDETGDVAGGVAGGSSGSN